MKFEASGLRLWMRSRRFRTHMLSCNRNFDVFVVSFPKCGRTWHRLQLGFYLTALLGRDQRNALDLHSLLSQAGLKRVGYTHNATSPSERIPITSPLFAWSGEWKDRRVIFLVREPGDVMVSLYNHVRFRTRMFNGDISTFVHSSLGLERYLTALERWQSAKEQAESFQIISYETMHRDPGAALRQVLLFAGAEPQDQLILEAIERSHFDRMREYEQSNYFSSVMLSNPTGDRQAAKVRAGRVGSSRTELSEADLDFISFEVERRGLTIFKDSTISATVVA